MDERLMFAVSLDLAIVLVCPKIQAISTPKD